MKRALADTSVLVGLEQGRIATALVDDYEWAISVVSLGELRLGLLMATDPESAAIRLATLELAQRFHPLPISEDVCEKWARLVAQVRSAGKRIPINDSWIAATAISHGVPVVTQDSDYDGLPGLEVLRF